MMLRARANEIPELVRQLGSRSRARVDAARARLSIFGARVVEDLIEALEGDDNRIRARVMPLLALIQDTRGREPLCAMLLDRNPRLRAVAARCLARFPAPDAVAALNRVLDRERREEVSVAAAHALVEQYAAGQEQAIRRVMELLMDSAKPRRIRLAAFGLLRVLRPAQRRSVVQRLGLDPDAEIRRRALLLSAEIESAGQLPAAEIQELTQSLAAEDYEVWNDAVQRLGDCGVAVIDPLIAEMQGRAHDAEYCTRAGMALKAMGPRRGRALTDALEQVEEPTPLQVLVEVIGALGEKSLIYRLKDLIERLADQSGPATEANGFDPMHRVRARAHLELARVGSRVAIQDLRNTLNDPEQRVELDLLNSVELIGKREEIPILLRAYGREDPFARERIASVVRGIMRRERIRRNNRMFRLLSREQRRALTAILPPTKRPPKSRKPASARGAELD